ncbi:hypothetical protein GCM10011386_27070 [Parapedobacter defluvii]|uniref:Uncharacterized protein n=1 Tax=Parapedobacter defluvii TaxID=2045106 RepID=A0ABQ1M4I2_9SPHI|nr:hypothetical protein [Parapedobacter defluvii]GGC33538.1 hypothetical protein GCM10011386_27070 [Parapedobacter defluvii]
MKYEIIHLMVRVMVQTAHTNISDTVHEVETESALHLDDTPHVKVLDTEILLTRVRNPKRN